LESHTHGSKAGRIDRIGTDFDELWIYNMFPDEGLDKLLGLVENLSRKIDDINQTGFLDSSILGETVNPAILIHCAVSMKKMAR